MNLDKRLKQIEDLLKQKRMTSKRCGTLNIPRETYIGAIKILIEAGVISASDYACSPDQLANEIYQGTITELDCLTNQNGQFDLSPLSDEQLTQMENLYPDVGVKQ